MPRLQLNNLLGGVIAGFLAIPESMAYAVIIFSPFAIYQPEILPLGVAACVLAVVFANLIPSLLAGPRIMVSTPFSLASVMLAVVATQIISSVTPEGGVPNIDLALVLLFAVVSISGFFQILLGAFRLADVAKFVPMPVIAGLRNGAAIVIIMSQLRPFFGLENNVPIDMNNILWPTTSIGFLAFLIMFSSPRVSKKIPGPIIAIIIGTLVYYILAKAGFSGQLTELVGAVPVIMPAPHLLDDFFILVTSRETLDLLFPLLPTAFALAILNTLQTLVAIVTADSLAETRSKPSLALIGQGISNFLCGLFGAMSAAGAVGSTLANYTSGGRGLVSRLSVSLLALAVLVLFGPLIGYLPKIVLAGCLIALALSMFDPAGFHLLWGALNRKVGFHDAAKDISIISSVMLILLAFGPLAAVGAGIIVALVNFIFSMAHNNIRRELPGQTIRSHVQRNEKEDQLLTELGKKVIILELEGPLFFGTSDRLLTKLEKLSKDAFDFILMDFTRINEFDSTAVSLVCQARKVCAKNECKLLLCSVEHTPRIARFLSTTKLFFEFQSDEVYPSMQEGMASIEDQLLDKELGPRRYEKDISFRSMSILNSIAKEHLDLIESEMQLLEYDDGDIVFRQEERADALYFISRGQVVIQVQSSEVSKNDLGVLCPGAVFGEMAILDGKPRSASIIALGKMSCLRLKIDSLEKIAKTHPDTRNALMASLGVELSKRIRVANRALTAFKI